MVPVSGFTGPCPEMNTKSPATTAWEYGPAGAGPFSAITVFLIDSPFLLDRLLPACIGASSYHCTFSCLQKGAGLYGFRTVDQDVGDPFREVFGIFVRGRVLDLLRVEHDQVRCVSRRDEPPLTKLEPPGREGGHLPDSFLQREQLLLPHVPGEDLREGAVETGMRLLGLVV